MSKLTQHRTRIRKRYNYSKSALEKGMICEMTYKRLKVKGRPEKGVESKKYMVVVLNADFRGYLHAMSLEEVSAGQLNGFADKWGLVSIGKGSAIAPDGVLTGLRVPKIEMKESSGRFYSSKFAKLGGTAVDSYRTYNIKQIGNISVCDYEWDNAIFDKQFAELIELKRVQEEALDLAIDRGDEKRKKQLEAKEERKEQKAADAAKKPTNL